jgi:hypothetical protein
MRDESRRDLASQRAEKYAPIPKNTALMAGVVGAISVGLLLAALAGFYMISISAYLPLFCTLVAAGFGIPFASSAYRRHKHNRAATAELRALDQASKRT